MKCLRVGLIFAQVHSVLSESLSVRLKVFLLYVYFANVFQSEEFHYIYEMKESLLN